tara:strand:- start:669 stop:875 length:207 start_codon:yes stop_codon:yes gene_type:complete
MKFDVLNKQHWKILDTVRNYIILHLQIKTLDVIDVTAKELGDKANKLYNKDLYECIGFSNGFKPENDL